MSTDKATDIRITYFPDEVVLQGDTRRIHTEAYKILMRFKFSSVPYHVKSDSDHQVVLSARHH